MTALEPKCCRGFRQGAQSSLTKVFCQVALSRTTQTHNLKQFPPPTPNPGGGEDPSPQGADDAAASVAANMKAPSGETVVWWAGTGKGTKCQDRDRPPFRRQRPSDGQMACGP